MFSLIKKFFHDFQSINKINSIRPKIVFYSENKSYQKYGYNLIEYFSKKFPGEVYYISSDKNDQVKEFKIINVHINSNILLQYLFLSLNADNLFMTATDLNNSILKKNKNVKNYIYYFHGAVSTTKVFTEKRVLEQRKPKFQWDGAEGWNQAGDASKERWKQSKRWTDDEVLKRQAEYRHREKEYKRKQQTLHGMKVTDTLRHLEIVSRKRRRRCRGRLPG